MRLTTGAKTGQDEKVTLSGRAMEGLSVHGTREVSSRPAFRNHTTSDVWRSFELGIVVMEKDPDSSGDHITRLTPSKRSMTDPSVFQLPLDYRIVDEIDTVVIKFRRPRYSLLYAAPSNPLIDFERRSHHRVVSKSALLVLCRVSPARTH
jgi:hypothetical protein